MIIYDKSDITIGSKVILKPEARRIYAHQIEHNLIDMIFDRKIPLTITGIKVNQLFSIDVINGGVSRKHFKPVIWDLVVFKFRDVFILAKEKLSVVAYFQSINRTNIFISQPKLRRQIDKTGEWDGIVRWGEDLSNLPIENLVIKSKNPSTRIVKNYFNPANEIQIY